jgi:hypothetical protein
MVRAEENRVRALRAMIVMQGIANGLQLAWKQLATAGAVSAAGASVLHSAADQKHLSRNPANATGRRD